MSMTKGSRHSSKFSIRCSAVISAVTVANEAVSDPIGVTPQPHHVTEPPIIADKESDDPEIA